MKNITHRPHQLIVLAIAGLAAAGTCNAEVIHNSFGPGDTHNTTSWGSGQIFPGLGTNNAVVFETGSSAMTDISITMPLDWSEGFFGGDDFSYSVRIYADNGIQNNEPDEPFVPDSSVPGTLVAEYVAMAQQTLSHHGTNFEATTVGFGDLILEGGTRYWLAVEAEFDTGFIFWYGQRTDIGLDPIGLISQSSVTSSASEADYWNVFWQDRIPAFRVEGTAVPTPGSMAIVGMMGVFASRRRRTA